MIICPECQHENTEDNQFCEKCGTSLTTKSCNQCGNKVDLSVINCPHCHALNLDIYLTVISQPLQKSFVIPKLEKNLASQSNPSQTYLDSGLRYGIFNSKNQNLQSLQPVFKSQDKCFYSIEVMDFKPLQKSSLDTILESIEELDRSNLVRAGIPEMTFPYLTLAEFYPLVPELYDAWKNEETGQEFVVISRPGNWQLLSEVLATKDFTLAQRLGFFSEMAKLWQPFSNVHCCQTLLEISNIGLDDHDSLMIKQIFPNHLDKTPQLQELLNFWLELLPDSLTQEKDALEQLLKQLNLGKIKDIKQLQSNINSLIEELQPSSSPDSDQQDGEDLLFLSPEDELEALSAQFDFEDDDEDEDSMSNATFVSGNIEDQPTVVLPTELLSISDAGHTDIGNRRSHNEDCFKVDTVTHKQETPQGIKFAGRGLYLVCDGMGGHEAGEIASAMAIEKLSAYWQKNWQQELPEVEVIQQSILFTNQAIYNVNIQKGTSGNQRMGTTLVMTLIQGSKIAIAHVGDSRIYRVTRKWGLEQLTTDHSVAQMDIKNGVDPQIAFSRVDAFQLTQALGPRDNNFVHPDIKIIDLKEDSLLLLCSDGLSDNNLLENNWQTHLSPLISSQANLKEGLAKIINLANQINGHDNITGVLIRVKIQPYFEG